MELSATSNFREFFDYTLEKKGEGYRLNLTPAQKTAVVSNHVWDKILLELFSDLNKSLTYLKTVQTHFQKISEAAPARMRKYVQDAPQDIKDTLMQNAHLIPALYHTTLENHFRKDSSAEFFQRFLRPIFLQSQNLPLYEFYPFQDRPVLTWEDHDFLGLKKEEVTPARDSAFDAAAWALLQTRNVRVAARVKDLYLSSAPLNLNGVSLLQSHGFYAMQEIPVPGDLALYRKESKVTELGVLCPDGFVMAKEKGGLTKRLIWQINSPDGTEVTFFRGVLDAIDRDEAVIAKRMEKDFHIPQELIDKLHQIAKGELQITHANGFKILDRGDYEPHRMFVHSDHPKHWIRMGHDTIVTGREKQREKEFESYALARRVIKSCQLSQLILPKLKKFNLDGAVGKYVFLVQEVLPYVHGPDLQEALYEEYAPRMAETARQLTVFVAETGFCRLVPYNIPILNEKEGYTGAPRVGLIHLGELDPNSFISKKAGIWGGDGTYGVVGCLWDEKQIDDTIALANKYNIYTHTLFTKQHRMLEIEQNQRLLRD